MSTRRGTKRSGDTTDESYCDHRTDASQSPDPEIAERAQVHESPNEKKAKRQSSSKSRTEEQSFTKKYTDDTKVYTYDGPISFPHPSIIKLSEETKQPSYNTVSPTCTCSDEACTDSHHHCPLCPSDLPPYNTAYDVQHHFSKIHTKNLFRYIDHAVVLCNLTCGSHLPSHYHCPKCGSKHVRTLHMRIHMDRCTTVRRQVVQPPVKRKVQTVDLARDTESIDNNVHVVAPKTRSQTGNTTPRKTRGRPRKNIEPFHSVWDGFENIQMEALRVKKEAIAEESLDVPRKLTEAKGTAASPPKPMRSQLYKIPGLARYVLLDSDANAAERTEIIQNEGETLHKEEMDTNGLEVDSTKEEVSKDKEIVLMLPKSSEHTVQSKTSDDDQVSDPRSNEAESQLFQIQEVTNEQEALVVMRALGVSPEDEITIDESQTGVVSPEKLATATIPHISIATDIMEIESNRCQTCCDLFHCPLCPKVLYKPQAAAKLRQHLKCHWKIGVNYKGLTSMKCNLPCNSKLGTVVARAHWHCPLCPQTKVHRSRLREHLDNHSHGRNRHMLATMPAVQTGQVAGNIDVQSLSKDQASNNTMQNSSSRDVTQDPVNSKDLNGYDSDDSFEMMETTAKLVEESHLNPPAKSDLNRNATYIEDLETLMEDSAQQSDLNDENIETPHQSHTPEINVESKTESSSEEISTTEKKSDLQSSANDGTGKPVSKAFELVAGLLSQDAVVAFGDLMTPLISYLGDLTGVVATQQDPGTNSYMLQGTWECLDNTRFIIESLEESVPSSVEDLVSSLTDICQQYPDRFPDLNIIRLVTEDNEENDAANVTCDQTEIVDEETIPWIDHETPCPYCSKVFRYRLSLFHHIGRKHDVSKPPRTDVELWSPIFKRMESLDQLDCPRCGKTFKQLLHAKIHYGTLVCLAVKKNKYLEATCLNPESGLFECTKCDYQTKLSRVLEQHYDYKHKEKTLQCAQCPKKFATARIMSLHVKSAHGKVTCEICGEMFHPSKIVDHVKMHNDRMLAENLKTSSNAMLKCVLCDYCTVSSELFNRHCKRSHVREDFACQECEVSFTNSADFRRHGRDEHGQNSNCMDARDNCQVCGKDMLRKNIMAHVRHKHQGVRRYQCPTCGKTFQTKYVLDTHKQTHLLPDQREYRYICSQCNMGFHNKTLYEEHKFSHNNQRPYICNICKSSFRQKTVLARHMLIHSSNKYACDICQRIYKTKHNLLQHRKRHNAKGIVYLCPCGNRFNTNQELELHQQDECVGAVQEQSETIQVMDAEVSKSDSLEHVILVAPGSNDVMEATDENQGQLFIIQPPAEEQSMVSTPDLLVPVERADQGEENISSEITRLVEALPEILEKPDNVAEDGDGSTSVQVLINNTEMVKPAQDHFLCGYCNVVFSDIGLVQTHIMTDHQDQFPQDTADLHLSLQ